MEEKELIELNNADLTDQEKQGIAPVEEAVIQLAIKGDAQAFEKLFMGTYRYVFSVVRHYLKNDQDAYDAIQNTYTRVYKGLHHLKNIDSFYPWLHRIAENCSKDVLAQNGIYYDADTINDDISEDDKTEEKDVTYDIAEVLKQLPDEQRELLIRVYYDQMTVAEIARMQNLPKSTVHNRLKAAKSKLKELLKIKGIEKPFYGGEPISMLSSAIRNAIGTELLSMAVAEEILHNVSNSENKKGAAVISGFARKSRNKAAGKIATIILIAVFLITLVILAAISIFFNLFSDEKTAENGSNIGQSNMGQHPEDDHNDSNNGFVVSGTDNSSQENQHGNSAKPSSSQSTSGSSSMSGNSSNGTSSSGTSATPEQTESSKPSSSGTTSSSQKPSSSNNTSSATSTQKPTSSSNSSSNSGQSSGNTNTTPSADFELIFSVDTRDSVAYVSGTKGTAGSTLKIPATYTDPTTNKTYNVDHFKWWNGYSGLENVKELLLPGTFKSLYRYSIAAFTNLEKVSFYTSNSNLVIKNNCVIDIKTKTLTAALNGAVIPSDGSVTTIAEGAFSGVRGVKNLVIPDAVTSIQGNGTFGHCDVENLTVGKGIAFFGDIGIFNDCTSLKTVVLSEGVKMISDYVFDGCTALTSITLPKTLKTINADAFKNCTSLKHVYYAGSAADKANITIRSGNSCLTSATWHYNS